MTMSEIDVFIYSYKGRIVKDVIRSLINNSSNNNKVNIILIDQNPIDRNAQFFEEFGINYRYIFWDFQKSPIEYKRKALIHSRADFCMSLSDNVLMNKNWDEELISLCKNDVVVSGSGKKNFVTKNSFFVNIQTEHSDIVTKSYIIDREFIFATSQTFKKFNFPVYLKYNGEQEIMSLDAFVNGIDVISAPSSLSSVIGINTLDELYVPFSLNHNYNAALTALQCGFNKYRDFNNKQRSLIDFEKAVLFNFKDLSLLPFSTNDVSYNPENLDFNAVDARRFVARTKSIH